MPIRPATPADSAALARIQVDSYRAAYAGILPADYLAAFTYEDQTQDWRDLLSADTPEGERDLLYVAIDAAGEVVGYGLGRISSDEPYPAEIVALHVRRDRQGQGHGHQLMAELARHFRARGIETVILWVLAGNSRARAIYEHLGGLLTGERTIPLSDDPDPVTAQEVAYVWPDSGQLAVVSRQ